jgi:hypothetical protein
MPNPANPQNLNRYSYVGNNPLRYTDPTGHIRVDNEGGGGKKGCSDPRYCENGQAKSKEELAEMRNKKKRDTLDIFDPSNRNQDGYLLSWEGEKDIDPAQWDLLLKLSREKAHSTPGIILFYQSFSFDTMFYNDHSKLSGRACLDDKCYDRSELNYVAQGELWAALGASNPTGHKIVKNWKESKCLWRCDRNDLQEEYDMFDIGYDHYGELYPHHPDTPYNTIPGILPIWEGPDV